MRKILNWLMMGVCVSIGGEIWDIISEPICILFIKLMAFILREINKDAYDCYMKYVRDHLGYHVYRKIVKTQNSNSKETETKPRAKMGFSID